MLASVDDRALDETVRTEQMRMLYAGMPLSLLITAINATLLAVVLPAGVNSTLVMNWSVAMLLVTLGRAALLIGYRRMAADVAEVNAWIWRFRTGALAAGLCWGAAGWWLFAPDDIAHQAFLAFVLAGMAAGAVSSLCADRPAVLAFLLLSLLPLMVQLLTAQEFIQLAMGSMVVLFLVGMSSNAQRIHRNIIENLRLRLIAEPRERALRQSEERSAALIESLQEGFQTIGYDWRCLYANDALARQLRQSKQSLLGRTSMEIYPGIETRAIFTSLRYCMEQRQPHHTEEEFIFPDGSKGWFELSIQPVAEGISVLSLDITERKQAEEEIRIAATAFESHEAIAVTDANSRVLRVNSAFTAITDYTVEEIVGQTLHLLSSGHHDADFYAAMRHSVASTGTWQGEIWSRRKSGEIYPQWLTISAVADKYGQISNYVAIFSDISARKQAEEEINRLAFYDPLTQLPNRRLLLDRLQQTLRSSARSQRPGALLFIDLDNFKMFNDALGHSLGDLLLQEVAKRLAAGVRETDTVARQGGDEFVVLLEALSQKPEEAITQAEAIAEKVLRSLSQPYQLSDHHSHHCTASVGVTLFIGGQESVDQLLKQADIAMYQSKQAGRNTIRFFDPQMQAIIENRSKLEAALRLALPQKQFMLYYQLQVDDTDQILGAEVLLRWLHPDRGIISPAEFIPLAEESGLIIPIGWWLLEIACRQLRKWGDEPARQHLQLAINVSARQFRQPDFVEQMVSLLHETGINPDRLKLELTESLVLDNVAETIVKMQKLKDIGVQFSMDDFGTGYSSLSYLKKLPLDQLKIDQSFIREIATDPDDAIIVQTIIAMAKNLGMEVIAEGVETEQQRNFLIERGCLNFQGYLFGNPVPLEEFEQLLVAREKLCVTPIKAADMGQ